MQSDLEMIDFNSELPVKSFVTSIVQSKLHWHYAYELLLVLKGKLQIFAGKKSFILTAGNLYLFNSREIHAIHGNESNIVAIIQIDNSLVERAEKNRWRYHFYLNSQIDDERPDHFSRLRSLIASLVLSSDKQSLPSYYLIRGQLMMIIAALFQDCVFDKQPNKPEDTNTLDDTIRFVDLLQGHLAVINPIAFLKEKTKMDPNVIASNIERNLGQTVNQLMIQLRVQKAMHLLRTSNQQIDYIIDICGFSSRRTFYREFKQTVGVTPLKYRHGNNQEIHDTKIRGYVSYDNAEAIQLLKRLRDERNNEN